MKSTVKECNYFGLKHDVVAKQFEGDLTYVGDMCLNEGQTVAVYRAANPNRAKGHKEFILLHVYGSGGGVVLGIERDQLAQHSMHKAVLCTICNTILYSVHRHDYHSCGCPNEAFVDGGKDYQQFGAVSMAAVEVGTYDVLNKVWSKSPTK